MFQTGEVQQQAHWRNHDNDDASLQWCRYILSTNISESTH